ncbi:hypothetical protein PoB_000662700 [Plakobranchus ocellatus]|uniref:Uncharacterized protein n=1 Tax=Plakobranchus ocellatus TaxID=259542 RepID=A0AAV3YDE1_9GAST|nr:hypothetical protein PoB_000662700 [Plakobranchus ocellatus]
MYPVQTKLDEQIKAIDDFLEVEEKRIGIDHVKLECGHDRKAAANPPAVNDRQVWTDSQASMRRAVDTLARCKTIIAKLHGDCLHVAQTNAELMTETRNCYLQLCGMVRPSTKCADEIQTATRTTQELFRLLVSDVNRLMMQRSKMAEREQYGRTSAMRILRKLRDWIVDRCTVLSTLHSSAPSAPLGNSRFLQRRGRLHKQPVEHAEGKYLATYKYPSDHLLASEDNSTSDVNSGKKIEGAILLGILSQSQSPNEPVDGSFLQDRNALIALPPVASSTPQPLSRPDYRNPEASAVQSVVLNIQPISSVVEGVHQLEGQLREYIHLEILLTDRFRQEMRRRQQQKKAEGLSSRGIAEAQNTISRLAVRYKGDERDDLSLLRSQLDQISMEYSDCCSYVNKAVESMVQIEDVENFLKKVQDREQAYRKNKIDHDEKKDANFTKSKVNSKESKALKREQAAYNALIELVRDGKKTKERQEKKYKINASTPREKATPRHADASSEDFLTRLKLLVANYEIVRLRMLTLEDRFRREVARRERETKVLLQGRDEEIFRLQTLLRESEAEKEKYCRLYENTKIGMPRKR